MCKRLFLAAVVIGLLAYGSPAFALDVWVGSLPEYAVVCSRTELDPENPDPGPWSELRETWSEEQLGDLGAPLALPAEAAGEGRVPCLQYFGSAELPEGVKLRPMARGRALFAYCPRSAAAPCYARVRELLGSDDRVLWSRPLMGWVDEEGVPHEEPRREALEAFATAREATREPPDSVSTVGQLGVLVVAHTTDQEASVAEDALAARPPAITPAPPTEP